MAFTKPEDIANRAIQHVGARRISTLSDISKQAQEINFCYDKLRRAELRRSVWRYATRRAMLQPVTSTSLRMLPAAWASGTTYAQGAVIQDAAGIYWISMFASNTGNVPGAAIVGRPAWWQQYFGAVVCDLWSTSTTYNAGDIVYKSGPTFYLSSTNNNKSADPASGSPWIALSCTSLGAPFYPQPVGPGMTLNGAAQTIFPLPNGYLRPAAQGPKAASTSTLNTSAGLQYVDWQFENDYIVSAGTAAIPLRFVADVSDVTNMDDLFAEGLAARIGYEVCETLTQSNVKLQAIGAAYQKFIRDARLVNKIETGNTEPEEEEYELTKGPQGVVDAGPAQPQAQAT